MYHGVVLIGDKTNLCIPSAWVFVIDVVRAFNSGVNRNSKKRIFFSKNLSRTPNFLLPLRSVFDSNEDGCYLAKVTRTFYTLDEGKAYMSRLRGGLPIVYNAMRVEMPPPFVDGEANVVAEIHRKSVLKVEIKTEMDNLLVPLRNTIVALNEKLPPIDLTNCDDDDIYLIESDDDRVNDDLIVVAFEPYESLDMVKQSDFLFCKKKNTNAFF